MNRNTQERFAVNPVNLDIQRSRFLMNPEVKTSFNLGDLFPIGAPIEVLPGDTFEVNTALAVRMQPLVSAPLDNLSFDYYWFFVPNRLTWTHWKEFMGENTQSAWIPQTQYTIPTLSFTKGCSPKSLADYMGIPIEESGFNSSGTYYINALPFRAFALIYNEWFRSENLIAPVNVSIDDTNRAGKKSSDTNYSNPTISLELGGAIPKAGKRPDYFVSALPGPQKGPDVTVLDHLPVYFDYNFASNAYTGRDVDTSAKTVDGHKYYANGNTDALGHIIYGTSGNINFVNWLYGSTSTNVNTSNYANYAQPYDWYVDGDLSISQLRIAFQIQKLYEKEARGGSRYREIIKEHFGVTSPDASQQVPQYLGGKRIPININSVIQSSETGTTPQGNVAGYSLTSYGSNKHDFIFSATEHGFLFCIGCARIDQHTYQQGIHRMWSRKNKLDYYFPVLANISEQPILYKEIYAAGDNTSDQVFGYQEAWAEYRYMPSIVTSEMRSAYSTSLDSWHFADDYSSLPYLSQSWFEEEPANVDRALAVKSNTSNQFFGDFAFYIKATRPMPMYSIPGLVDHH